jgi:hypothetical protein
VGKFSRAHLGKDAMTPGTDISKIREYASIVDSERDGGTQVATSLL